MIPDAFIHLIDIASQIAQDGSIFFPTRDHARVQVMDIFHASLLDWTCFIGDHNMTGKRIGVSFKMLHKILTLIPKKKNDNRLSFNEKYISLQILTDIDTLEYNIPCMDIDVSLLEAPKILHKPWGMISSSTFQRVIMDCTRLGKYVQIKLENGILRFQSESEFCKRATFNIRCLDSSPSSSSYTRIATCHLQYLYTSLPDLSHTTMITFNEDMAPLMITVNPNKLTCLNYYIAPTLS